MDDYLPKPIELAQLIDLIRSWCHQVEPAHITLPSIDWQLALKRANQNHDAAKELLTDFIELLPDAIVTIRTLWEKRDFNGLKAEIHKLHGACCYTGVPRLQNLADELETALKLGQHFIVEEHIPTFLNEAQQMVIDSKKSIIH